MSVSQFISWCVAAITFGTVIMYGCIGETINQKAGDLNLGVPGVMMIGGIASLASAFIYESSVADPNPFLSMVISLLSCLIASALAGALYAFLTVTQKVNQNVTGLTLTIFGTGIANFFGGNMMKLSGGVGTISVARTANVFRAKLPGLFGRFGDSFKIHIEERKHKTFPVYQLTMLIERIMTGARPMTDGPFRRIKEMKKPILFLHSRKDQYSLAPITAQMYEDCPSEKKEIVWFDEGQHSRIRLKNQERYDAVIADWTARIVAPAKKMLEK